MYDITRRQALGMTLSPRRSRGVRPDPQWEWRPWVASTSRAAGAECSAGLWG